MEAYARIRYRNNLQAITGKMDQTITSRGCPTGTVTTTTNWTSSPVYQVGSYESMSDIVTPGFAKASRDGAVVMKPMTKIRFEVDGGYGTGQDLVATKSNSCTANPFYPETSRICQAGTFGRMLGPKFNVTIFPNGTVAPLPRVIPWETVQNLIAEASTSARADRGRGNSNSNQYEALAELNKSFGMLGQATQNALDFTKKNSSKMTRAKAVANAYLLYRYGFIPLMMSIQDATQAMSRAVGKVRQTSRGSASVSQQTITTVPTNLFSIWTANYVIRKDEKVTVRSMFLDEYEATLITNSGLSLKNLATLPWELLPYSFVVDWFANIGDYLASMYPTFGLTPRGSCTTVERQTSYSVSCSSFTPNSTYWDDPKIVFPSHGYTVRSTVKDRIPEVAESSLVLRSNFKLDQLTRASDAIALLTQKLRK